VSGGAADRGPGESPRLIGLISDTHGLLRPDVHRALAGVELILHAGDVGGDEVLDELALIAPVLAVWGNTDPPGMPRLSGEVVLPAGGLTIHVSHGHELGSPTPAKLLERYAGDVLVYGHTHRQLVTRAGGRLVVNPGAAGPRRFDLMPSVARLTVEGSRASVDLVELRL
jgi:putative phosphoesterase